MKYNVVYSCGHEGTAELFGKTNDRMYILDQLRTYGLCPDCEEKEKAKGCQEVTMKYAEYKNKYPHCDTKRDSYDKINKTITVYVPDSEEVQDKQREQRDIPKRKRDESELPELEGTEREVAYADDIRRAVLNITKGLKLDELDSVLRAETRSQVFIKNDLYRSILQVEDHEIVKKLKHMEFLIKMNLAMIEDRLKDAPQEEKDAATKHSRELLEQLYEKFERLSSPRHRTEM